MIFRLPATGRLIGPGKGDPDDPIDFPNFSALLSKDVILSMRFDSIVFDEDAGAFDLDLDIERPEGETDTAYAARRDAAFAAIRAVVEVPAEALLAATGATALKRPEAKS